MLNTFLTAKLGEDTSLIGYVDNWALSLLNVLGISHSWAAFIKFLVLLICVVVISLLLQGIFKFILHKFLTQAAKNSSSSFLKHATKNKVPKLIAMIAPYTFIRNAIPHLFSDYMGFISPCTKILDAFFVFALIWVIMSIIESFTDSLQEKDAFKDKPMKSYLQVIQIILFIIGGLAIFSIFTGKSISSFLIAMGGASALMMFIFQDSLKGLISSIQLTFNNMVKLGDWITVPGADADGSVEEISLTTVKIRNFDKTVTTVPTGNLVTGSFQNWRAMQETGTRRIQKTIPIKLDTIRFVTNEELAEFKKVAYIKDYIEKKEKDYAERNKGVDTSLSVGYHQMTNNELYVAYMQTYLETHPNIAKDGSILMARQKTPGADRGFEVELYVFTNTVAFAEYEAISTEIMNHAIGVARFFKLDIFEFGSDTDIIPIDIIGHKK